MTTLYTIGHSTRGVEEFIHLLRSFGVERVVDIRTIPRSRHNPQFEGEALAKTLRNRRVGYRHMKELGGLRHAAQDSPNKGWRNSSFRGFADHMASPEFARAVEALAALARERPTAIMCAEAVPWRCHRYLIADALVIRALTVEHILGAGISRGHTLNPMAVVQGLQLTYP